MSAELKSVEKNLAGAIPVTTLLTQQRICDMFVGACEGGSTYWCEEINLTKSVKPKLRGVIWWGSENIYQPGIEMELKVDDEEDTRKLTWDSIVHGARKMAVEQPRHFSDILTENDDATTADVFLQYCTFGEIVYG
jgi:hypothetical protein